MKKIWTLPLSMAVLLIINNASAQTNTFPASGNVGIGTTAPASILGVNLNNTNYTNVSGSGSHILMTNPNVGGQNVISSLINGVTAAKWRTDYVGNVNWISNASASDRGHYFYIGGDFPNGSAKMKITPSGVAIGSSIVNVTPGNYFEILTSDNTTRSLVVNSTGNVGIGTTNVNDANYKLFVETGIRTRKVKVDQAIWPDYVFDRSYKLLSLQKVEAFIKTNRHLPGVPSAAQVQKEGLDLGDNQATLLKKIEELTLYVIALKKQVDEQKEINDKQTKIQRRLLLYKRNLPLNKPGKRKL